MVGYGTHGYLTIAGIFHMVSSTLCGSLLITFSSHNIYQLHLLKFHGTVNRQPVRQKQVGIDLNGRDIDQTCSKLYTFCLVFIMVADCQEGPQKKGLFTKNNAKIALERTALFVTVKTS